MSREEFRTLIENIQSENKSVPFCSDVKEIPVAAFPSFHVNSNAERTEIILPIKTVDVERLKTVSSQAPYGKGQETIIDREVRDTLQVNSESLEVNQEFADRILTQLLQKMGIDDSFAVEAKLYKLLIYSENGHFVKHRDTEKEKGMFATMIIQLPCEEGYDGGELVIHHNGRKEKFDMRAGCQSDLSAVLLYADCEHELKPVTKGHRVALTYNIVWKAGNGVSMMMTEKEGLSKTIALESFIQKWTAELLPQLRSANVTDLNPSEFFQCIPLEHQYTELNISFMGLKGNDSQLAKLVSKHSNLHVFLGLQCKYMEGETENCCDEADCDKDMREGCWVDDNPFKDYHDFAREEEAQVSYSMETLTDLYGAVLPINLSVDDFHEDLDAIFPDSAVKARLVPAGNEGVTLEKWYYSACLMITPKAAFYPFLAARNGFKSFLNFLDTSLSGMKLNLDLTNAAVPVHAREYDSYIDSALATQTSVDMDCIRQLLSLHIAFDFPKTVDRIPDFLFDKNENAFQNVLHWSVEEVVYFILCLVPSGDSIFLHHVRDALIEDGNDNSAHCFLHRFLVSGKVWEKVDQFSEWSVFMKLMKELCMARITSLKELPVPNMNTWSFPEAQVSISKLQQFLISEEEVQTFDYEYSDYMKDCKKALQKQKNFSVTFEETKQPKGRGYTLKVTKTKEFFQKKLTIFRGLQETAVDLEERIRQLK
jgi:predicted 2-oxoglutarate/Fe(II)-dependent dioxygenase YbiX